MTGKNRRMRFFVTIYAFAENRYNELGNRSLQGRTLVPTGNLHRTHAKVKLFFSILKEKTGKKAEKLVCTEGRALQTANTKPIIIAAYFGVGLLPGLHPARRSRQQYYCSKRGRLNGVYASTYAERKRHGRNGFLYGFRGWIYGFRGAFYGLFKDS